MQTYWSELLLESITDQNEEELGDEESENVYARRIFGARLIDLV